MSSASSSASSSMGATGGREGKFHKNNSRSNNNNGHYTSWGWVPLDNCVTAVVDNLSVNFPSSSSSKKQDVQDGGGKRVLVGAVHLDSFLIHEVSTDGSKQEFMSKHVNSIHLPSILQNRCVIFRAKWVSLASKLSGNVKLLVLCTNLATYFYNEMGTKQLGKFEYATEDIGGEGEHEQDMPTGCCRTIATIKSHILLGNDRGEVHLLSIPDSRKGNTTIQLTKTLQLLNGGEPVVEMCARKSGLLVVGSQTGSLSVWTISSEPSQRKITEYLVSKPETVTSLQLWSPYCIAAYGSGIIRMFNLFQKCLVAQVYAHSRWISCMDLCTKSSLLLTVGEDDHARIWTLRRRQKGEQRSPIKLHSTIHIEDANLIGAKFLNANGSLVGLCNLGNKDIAVYAADEFFTNKR